MNKLTGAPALATGRRSAYITTADVACRCCSSPTVGLLIITPPAPRRSGPTAEHFASFHRCAARTTTNCFNQSPLPGGLQLRCECLLVEDPDADFPPVEVRPGTCIAAFAERCWKEIPGRHG